MQVASGRPEWALLEGSAIHFDELKDELFLGGVYVRLFLANPQFPLRQPNRFLEALVQSYTDLLQVWPLPALIPMQTAAGLRCACCCWLRRTRSLTPAGSLIAVLCLLILRPVNMLNVYLQ